MDEQRVPSARLGTTSGANGEAAMLQLTGAWRLASLERIERQLRALALPSSLEIDGSALTEIDSAAALALLRRVEAAGADPRVVPLVGFAPNQARVLEAVRRRLRATEVQLEVRHVGRLEALGRYAASIGSLLLGHVRFLGETAVRAARTVVRPSSLRVRELTVQLQRICLEGIPVVALVLFLVGVVITYLLGLEAEKYGATLFVVDGVGIGITREFAPIVVAVIVAGRSGSSFTAQLGTMQLTEETDAIRTLGLSPIDVLVLPRVVALVAAMVVLVFVGNVAGILGSIVIADATLGITPVTFIERLHALDPNHLYVGLAKGPVFGLAIALIGCRMGMTVHRDTRAVGIATTSTVVQSIVAVILLDAGFAVFFQKMGI
jgi:phospholipid/cholesterol/gamma-HCH transport system permease protein